MVRSAAVLTDPGRKLAIARHPERWGVTVPATAPDSAGSVVVLELEGEPVVVPLTSVGATVSASASLKGNGPENALDGTAAKRWRARRKT